MTPTISRVLVLASCLLLAGPANGQTFSPDDLYDMAERYCIGPDGDHELTQALAEHDKMRPITAEDFPGLRLPGARRLTGYTAELDGVVFRVLTARNRIRGGGGGITFFHLCWVSAEPMNRRAVDRTLQRETGIRGFRQEGARVFAWVPGPDGARLVVDLREWRRRNQAIAREDGMRMILTNQHQGMTAVTYMTPVTDCADWCY